MGKRRGRGDGSVAVSVVALTMHVCQVGDGASEGAGKRGVCSF